MSTPGSQPSAALPRIRSRILVLSVLALLSGCLARELAPLNPCTTAGVKEVVKVSNVEKVDLLFVIDNSLSMNVEQGQIEKEIPKLVRVLTTGDRDGDGRQDFPPVRSLNVGVITTDMGSGGNRVKTCDAPDFGDDAALRSPPVGSECDKDYPEFLEFTPGSEDDATVRQFQCLAVQGTDGCGFEQQLEATLKAVTPSSSDIVFHQGTKGQADRANAGFIREDSLLAVIMATDEEDCSASNPGELFNTASQVLPEPVPDLRCFRFKDEALHPVQRYIDGLIASRPSPDLFVFAGIIGIPVSNDGAQWAGQEFDEMLAHPKMQEVVDATSKRLRTSCEVAKVGNAYPPRRIVEVARGLKAAESNAIIQSICQESYAGALDAILGKIADVLGGACLPRALTRDASGIVDCEVTETLPIGRTCTEFAGRTYVETEDGREVCRVQQLAVTGQAPLGNDGWYYDDFTAEVMNGCQSTESAQRIAFAAGAAPVTGSLVDLQCLQQLSNTMVNQVTLGSQCAPNEASSAPVTATTFCDAQTNTYQFACDSDAQCVNADLPGWRCWSDRSDGPSYCVNPTCSGQ